MTSNAGIASARKASAQTWTDDDAHAIWGDRGTYGTPRAFAYVWERKRNAYAYTPVGVTERISARGIVKARRTRTRGDATGNVKICSAWTTHRSAIVAVNASRTRARVAALAQEGVC